MSFDPTPFQLAPAIQQWGRVFGLALLAALFVGLVVSFLTSGVRGPGIVARTVVQAMRDLIFLSPRRIWALAMLAFKEAFARRALYVLFVIVALFAGANLFLRSPDEAMPAKPYISFVMLSMLWVLLPVAILLSCWGLPADIKDRSLHTVVTKPVRRSEIVLGRMLGYSLVITLVVAIIAPAGWLWIRRVVPARSQPQLISRVPVFANRLVFLTRDGVQGTGVNVGDIWVYREFIEGQTKARAIYEFTGITPERVGEEGLPFEYRFEAFRTHKGNVEEGEGLRFRMMLLNPNKPLQAAYPQRGPGEEIQEFTEERTRRNQDDDIEGNQPAWLKRQTDAKVFVPRELVTAPLRSGEEPRKIDLFNDLVSDGRLIVEVRCEDSGQYLGCAKADLFVSPEPRPFVSTYAKGVAGLWLMVILVVILGTTASCFVKGPVATLLTVGLVILGQPMRTYMDKQLTELDAQGAVLGGGLFESMYRLFHQMNQQSPLPDNMSTDIMQRLDAYVFNALVIAKNVIPDFTHFDMTPYVANGFDVPFNDAGAAVLPSLLLVLGYLLPCLIIGYLSLQLRELEAK